MYEFKTDLHIHTVLSPCGGLDMSPVKIIEYSAEKGLDIIGITDHNTTRHCRLIRELGAEKGIFVLMGAEVNTKEEVHCLAFFESLPEIADFQEYLDRWLIIMKNDPHRLGDQVQVNREDEIIYIEERSLYASLNRSLEEVEQKVHELGGIFIPAHIDRSRNSILSQLGFYPAGLKADAIEISRTSDQTELRERYEELKNLTMIKSSDAHYPEDIGRAASIFTMKSRSFGEIKLALKKTAGREVKIL